MRIGIDGRPLQGSRTGVGRYVYELCRHLDYLLPEAEFFIYSNVTVDLPVLSSRWKLRLDTWPLAKHMKPVLWFKLRCGFLCRTDNLDVFWGSATFLPSISKKIRTVSTVYDLTYKIAAKSMSFFHRWAYRLFFEFDTKRADYIITISNGTSDRLFKLFGRRADSVISPGVDSRFKPQAETEIKVCLDSYGILSPYILSVATWEPRKNLETLIQAFLGLKKRGLLPRHRLILVGGRGWKDKRLSSLIGNASGIDVLALGYVPDESLPSIYSGADLFVFPSTYEGFGMPVLESRACGTRIITSDTPELREAGGEDAIYIPPTLDGIHQGILAGLSQGKSSEAIEQRLPTWEIGARKLAAALVDTAGMGSTSKA